MRTTGKGNENSKVRCGWNSVIVLRKKSEEGFTKEGQWLGGRKFSPSWSRSGLILNAERALVLNMGLSYAVVTFKCRAEEFELQLVTSEGSLEGF